MSGKFDTFLRDFGGFLVGAIIGILVTIIPNAVNFIMTIIIVLLFGWFGHYIQRNKLKVKEVLKNLIEKW